jgi:hypothetical protein
MDIVYSEDLKHAYFNGIKFYRHGDYYKNHKYGRLHVYIWKYFNGVIEKGYHVHHKDENKMNNDITNLILLSNVEHGRLHAKENGLGTYERTEEHIKKLQKPLSEETKIKISEKIKGRKVWNKDKKDEFHHNDEAKRKISENNPRKVLITEEMIEDYKNGISRKEFLIKYNVSRTVWYKTRDKVNEFKKDS